MTAALTLSDFVRAPVLAAARPDDFKEWHHFVVHGPELRVLINFSLTGHAPAAPRVIVIVHDRRWSGAVARFDTEDLDISADLGSMAIGANRLTLRPDGYDLTLDLPAHDIRGELHLTSVSKPFVVNNQPVGAGTMNWLFVPRLRTDGWLRIRGQNHPLDGAVAYHDHNWGRFRWGGDFGWTWGTILPRDADDPWSFVVLQMTDRARLRALSQALYVWHHGEPAAIFRHAAVRMHSHGVFGHGPDCTLPPPMRLVLDGRGPGVAERIDVEAHRAGDTVRAEFRPTSYVRLAQPSEVRLDAATVLCETSGTAHVTGRVGGRDIDFVGTGVFEFLHG